MKQCKRCSQYKEQDKFYIQQYHTRKDGTKSSILSPYCKSCYLLRAKERKERSIQAVFPNLSCSHCGYDKCVEALDFHHIDPSQKDFTIGQA